MEGEDKKSLIEEGHPVLSISRQCELLDLPRSTYYYTAAEMDEENLKLMRWIDEQYMKCPYYGSPRMTEWLRQEKHVNVNHKRIERLMRLMGIRSVLTPKRKRKQGEEDRGKRYPYLLEGMTIEKPNEVWCSDISYIPMRYGFMYLVAVMDWCSRYVLSWQLSNTMDVGFCVDALEDALRVGGKPQIFNTDQGSQYTSQQFTNRLQQEEIAISMVGKGRCWDNIFIERLWWSVKYEDVYTKNYETVGELYRGLEGYFRHYNEERLHQSLGYRTPHSVQYG